MKRKKTLFVDRVGPVAVVPNKRSRRLSISVRAFRPVRVTVPYHTPLTEALSLVEDNVEWIVESRQKMEAVERKQTVFTEDLEFRTRSHVLDLVRGSRRSRRITPGRVRVTIPSTEDLHAGPAQRYIRDAIVETYRREAKEILPQRLFELSFQFGFTYNKVSVRDTRSQWGSCSNDNNISLSLHLVRLPDELIDYVLLHELVHTRVKNHGPKYWKLLDQVTYGNARRLDKLLREWKIGLI